MNELLKFEGQEVKVKTDKGVTLINLVHTAKCCGLTREQNGYLKIRWTNKGIAEKLRLIKSTGVDKKYLEEIQYILEEIENADDRNTIYMSSWLSKRLALECNSDRAMRYKNFLVTLDEKRETGALMTADQLAPHVYQLAQGTQILGQVMEGMQAAMVQMQEYVKDSIQAKDHQIEQAMDLIGLRAVNVRRLSGKLKEKLSKELDVNIKLSNEHYRKAKTKVFKEFGVSKWEDIPVNKYNAVYAYIEEIV